MGNWFFNPFEVHVSLLQRLWVSQREHTGRNHLEQFQNRKWISSRPRTSSFQAPAALQGCPCSAALQSQTLSVQHTKTVEHIGEKTLQRLSADWVSAGHVAQVSTPCCLTAPIYLGFIMCIKMSFHLKFCFKSFPKLHQKPQQAKENDPLLQCWSKAVGYLSFITCPNIKPLPSLYWKSLNGDCRWLRHFIFIST